jgi:hypothetical protein
LRFKTGGRNHRRGDGSAIAGGLTFTPCHFFLKAADIEQEKPVLENPPCET